MASACLCLALVTLAVSFMQDNVFAYPVTVDQSLNEIHKRLERLEKLESCLSQDTIAFTAILQNQQHVYIDGGNHVNFDGILENTGNAYKDGHFTAPTNGIYAFVVHFTDGDDVQRVYLCKNGAQERVAFADSSGRYASSTVFSIMHVNQGDIVDVRAPSGGAKIIGYDQSSFSGILIQPTCSKNLRV